MIINESTFELSMTQYDYGVPVVFEVFSSATNWSSYASKMQTKEV